MLENHLIGPSQSSWSLPLVLVPKSDGSTRLCIDFFFGLLVSRDNGYASGGDHLCIDYRKVNAITKTESYPVLRLEDCIDRVGSAMFFTKMDFLKGYRQVPLTARAKEIAVAIRDDYSDPFDAKNELKNIVIKKREVENNGYMEPYEAQKMMAEIHKQESQKKEIQLYDTPCELEGSGVVSDTECDASYLRESKLPQDDTRPAEEYDQPWEWNKVTVPTLAVQFNGIEKRQSSPLRDRRRQLMPPGLIKHGGPEFCGIIGERIDPNTPLEKQVWYHGAISRTDAENLLRLCKECSYLIRNSQSNKNDYSLSLK
ncbi:SH2 domain-containing adapter protein B-like [Heterodontus francisci]|uniref:SH2 domain-containing adapter protein B-like n=1 Tax=Heterodontus francisci TaxID=7792 RepID=UPI00355B4329